MLNEFGVCKANADAMLVMPALVHRPSQPSTYADGFEVLFENRARLCLEPISAPGYGLRLSETVDTAGLSVYTSKL